MYLQSGKYYLSKPKKGSYSTIKAGTKQFYETAESQIVDYPSTTIGGTTTIVDYYRGTAAPDNFTINGDDLKDYSLNVTDTIDVSKAKKKQVIAATYLNTDIRASKYNDTIYGNSGRDVIYAGAGNDVIYGGAGAVNKIYGEAGNDYIVCGGESTSTMNFVDGGAGNDTIYGSNGGNDSIDGGAGNDVIYGGVSTMEINGDAGNDRLYTDRGNAYIHGGDGNDSIYGNENDNALYGDAGNDVIYTGASKSTGVGDMVRGGAGNDTIFVDGAGQKHIHISNYDGNDVIYGVQTEGAKIDITFDDNPTLSYTKSGNNLVITRSYVRTNTLLSAVYLNTKTGKLTTVPGKNITDVTNRVMYYKGGKYYLKNQKGAVVIPAGTQFYNNGSAIVMDETRSLYGTTTIVDYFANATVPANITVNGDDPYDDPAVKALVGTLDYSRMGAQTVAASFANHIIYGSNYDDTINTGSGKDEITANRGNDTINVDGNGDKTIFIANGDGNDVINIDSTKGAVVDVVFSNVPKLSYEMVDSDLVITRTWTNYNGRLSTVYVAKDGSLNLSSGTKVKVSALYYNSKNGKYSAKKASGYSLYKGALYATYDGKVTTSSVDTVTESTTITDYTNTLGVKVNGKTLKVSAPGDTYVTGTAKDDAIALTGNNVIVAGSKGDDVIYSNNAGNTYAFDANNDSTTIYSNATNYEDKIVLKNSLKNTISYMKSEDDLVISSSEDTDIVVADYFTTSDKAINDIYFSSNIDSVSAVNSATSNGIIVKNNDEDYLGNDENNLIVTRTDRAYTNAGGGNDTTFVESQTTFAELRDTSGNDKYFVSNIDNTIHIYDYAGDDVIYLSEAKDNIRFTVELYIDGEGNIINMEDRDNQHEGQSGSDLEIYTKATRDRMIKKGVDVDTMVVRDIFDGLNVDHTKTLVSADGYQITSEKLQEISENLAAWLKDAGFSSSYETMGTKQFSAAIAYMDQQFANSWEKINP